MTVNELKTNIYRGNIENIYLFAGPEIGEKNEVITMIEKKIFGNEQVNKYTFYYGSDFDFGDFADMLDAGMLFSEKKLVVLKNIEQVNSNFISKWRDLFVPGILKSSDFDNIIKKIKSTDKQADLKKSYKHNPEKNLYMLDNSLKDSEIKKLAAAMNESGFNKLDKDTYLVLLNETTDRIPSEITGLLNQSQNIIFWEMFDNQKPAWIRQEFKKYNQFIEDDAIEIIIDLIENNKYQLESEISKIALSLGSINSQKDNVVRKDAIEEYLYHSKEETAFTLYSAITEKKLEKALEVLNKIFYTEEESIVNGLLWCHRRFAKALDLYENENKTVEEICSTIKINTKKGREEIARGIENYNFYHINIMYHYLSELDFSVKVFSEDLKLVKLQEFIINFIIGDIKKSFLTGDLTYMY